MKAAILYDIEDLRYEETISPKPGENEVLVSVQACGICGSDLPRYLSTGSYDMPKILGHEFMGKIVECGNNVTFAKAGDRVAVNPLIPCNSCDYCKKNMFFHCRNYGFLGSRLHGGLAENVVVPAENLIVLSDSVSDQAGAMLEPVTVAYHCVKRMEINPKQTVVVFGAGAIGILIGQWALSKGANVTIVDIREQSLKIANKCGLKSGMNALNTDVVEEILSQTDGFGADITIEAAGARKSTLDSFKITANRGKVGLVGRITGSLELTQKDMELIQRKEIAVQGLWGFDCSKDDNDWEAAAEGLSNGSIIAEPLITHNYPLSKTAEAIKMMTQGQEYYCKVLVKVQEE